MTPSRLGAARAALVVLALALGSVTAPPARAEQASASEQASARAFLGQWLAAWRAQDIEAYAALYAPDARVDSRDRAAFLEHKKRVFARGERPGILVGDVEVDAIEREGERLLRTRFDQDYRSPALSDFGSKELLLRGADGTLLIAREAWTASSGVIEVPFAAPPAAPVAAPPSEGPLLGGEYVSGPAPEAGDDASQAQPPGDDLLESEPLLAPPPPALTIVGLPDEMLEGGHRVVEEIVARVNGRILTRSMFMERIAWYQETLLAEDPPDLEERLRSLATETLDTTIDRWVLLQEAQQRSADIEAFWREWLALFRRQVGADDMEELEQLLSEQGTSLARLRDQVVETEIPNMYLQQEIAGRLTFSEAELREHFEKNRARYQPSQRVTFRQILIPVGEDGDALKAEALARHVIDELAAGRDWCELNAVYGMQGSACADLEGIPLADLAPELRETAAGIPLDAVSKPVQSPKGFHVLRVSARQGAEPIAFDAVRDTVLRDLRSQVFDAELKRVLEELRSSAEITINDRYRAPASASAKASSP